jgi:small subunit ribosomal protein S1
MRVHIASNLGFCSGVRRAISMAEDALRSGPVSCLGQMIHNPREMERLALLGLTVVESPDDAKEATLIMRTHGSPPGELRRAEKLGLATLDATCPHVHLAQSAAQQLAGEGYKVVIIGDSGHPEVAAVVEWAGEGAQVVKDEDEAKALPDGRFGVISQTTERRELVDRIVSVLSNKGEVKLINTICDATQKRQDTVRQMARNVSVVIVVGGKMSANTNQLARIARKEGAVAHLVESAAEIDRSWFTGVDDVLVTAGASTPDWIIKEVVDLLEEMENKNPVPDEPEKGTETEAAPTEVKEEAPVAEVAAPTQAESETARDLEMAPPHVGDIVTATVVSVDDTGAMVDIGYKSEGIIERKELGKKPDVIPGEVVKPGQEIQAMVLALESGEGAMKLSKRRADEVLAWTTLHEMMEAKTTIEAPVVQQVKGGLVVDVGLRGFVPASQVERGFASDLEKYVGQTLSFKVIEIDKSKNRVILSRRSVLDEDADAKKKTAWEHIHEGDVLTGAVKSLTDFGAFVDLGGVDGLLHVSELSWGRVKHPSDVLTVGQEISVKVLRIDAEKGRISLGYKQTQSDPWSNVVEKYAVGSMVKGKVTRVAPFGAFVELEDGVEGLIHISELSDRRINKPEEVVQPGQEITAKVLRVKPEERRISLSMREADERPAKRERPERAPREEKVEVEPERLTIGDVFGRQLQQALEGKKPEKE